MDLIKGTIRNQVQVNQTTCSKICSKHGEYQADTVTTSGEFRKSRTIYTQCPKCEAEHYEEMQNNIKKYIDSKVKDCIRKVGIPKRYTKYDIKELTPVNNDQKNIIERCIKYSENFNSIKSMGTSLLFTGKPGTGKTMIALSMVNKIVSGLVEESFKKVKFEVTGSGLIPQNVTIDSTCIYKNVYDLFSEVRETYNKNSEETELSILSKYTYASLLILDEVGAQSGSDFETMMLFRIINNRYENLKSTFIISNLTDTDLSKYIGERTVDRFYENNGAVFIFNWESHRRTK